MAATLKSGRKIVNPEWLAWSKNKSRKVVTPPKIKKGKTFGWKTTSTYSGIGNYYGVKDTIALKEIHQGYDFKNGKLVPFGRGPMVQTRFVEKYKIKPVSLKTLTAAQLRERKILIKKLLQVENTMDDLKYQTNAELKKDLMITANDSWRRVTRNKKFIAWMRKHRPKVRLTKSNLFTTGPTGGVWRRYWNWTGADFH